MQKTKFMKILSCIICVVMIAAISLFTFGCTDNNPAETTASSTASVSEEKLTVLGEGQKTFFFTAVDTDGKETKWEIHTDEKVVGKALLAFGLIAGDDGPYGLYVKTVKDITIDYDTDGMYWAFYIGEEMAPTGVDMTEIVNGTAYRFVATKG